MKKGKEFISQLKLYSDYLKWNDNLGRYEKWEEACDSILSIHTNKYGDIIEPYINEIKKSMYNKEFLASQRSLQFRKDAINKHNAKLYNCCTTYAYSPDIFNKSFYVLLCGCGLGVSLKNKYVRQMPTIYKRNGEAILYVIEDSIEGWSDAIKVLMSSYCQHESLDHEYFGKPIKYDYSLIRPKGSYISGGFKAPGPEGLKSSIEKIELLLNNSLNNLESIEFKSVLIYDILMHISDAVLSGGIRRSAMNVIIDSNDTDMIQAKTGKWRDENPQRARSNNSVGLIKHSFNLSTIEKLISINSGDNDLGFVFMNHEDDMFNPCFEISMNFYDQIKNKNSSVFQFCNLSEINASACIDSKNNFSENKFYDLCRYATIIGTFQAGFTNFPYLGNETECIVKGEALIGVSITGWMSMPELFNEEILNNGANVVKQTNKEVSNVIGINQAARTTTTKPSGNACLGFDSLIKTELGDMKLIEIFEYCLGQKIDLNSLLPEVYAEPSIPLKIYNENNELENISKLYVNGLTYVYDITFEDGNTYQFTENHKLKTINGWKKVRDLTIDDEIISY